MPVKSSVQLMSGERIQRSIIRIAYQIFEECRGSSDLLIIGIERRGVKLANLIRDELDKITQSHIPLENVSIDGDQNSGNTFTSNVTGKYVILVDDVIFSGKTIYKAIQKIAPNGEPRKMMVAVLIDRGHREYPIEAQFVGLESPTKLDEHVSVAFSDTGKPLEVVLEKG